MSNRRIIPSNVGPRAPGNGLVVEDVSGKMRAFDRLPAEVREELNYTALDFSPLSALQQLQKGYGIRAIMAGIRATVAEVFRDQRAFLRVLAHGRGPRRANRRTALGHE